MCVATEEEKGENCYCFLFHFSLSNFAVEKYGKTEEEEKQFHSAHVKGRRRRKRRRRRRRMPQPRPSVGRSFVGLMLGMGIGWVRREGRRGDKKV